MSAAAAEWLSIREFARRDGCDEARVRRGLKTGHLPRFHHKKIPAHLVGTDWREGNRRSPIPGADTDADSPQDLPRVSARPGETPEQAAERIALNGAPYSRIEAERIGANYIALLRQVEYDQKVGRVALIEDIVREVGKEHAGVRTRLLALPSELAVPLAGLTSPAEVQARLAAAVHEALAEMTADRG